MTTDHVNVRKHYILTALVQALEQQRSGEPFGANEVQTYDLTKACLDGHFNLNKIAEHIDRVLTREEY